MTLLVILHHLSPFLTVMLPLMSDLMTPNTLDPIQSESETRFRAKQWASQLSGRIEMGHKRSNAVNAPTDQCMSCLTSKQRVSLWAQLTRKGSADRTSALQSSILSNSVTFRVCYDSTCHQKVHKSRICVAALWLRRLQVVRTHRKTKAGERRPPGSPRCPQTCPEEEVWTRYPVEETWPARENCHGDYSGGGAEKSPNPELCARWAGPVQQVENYARRCKGGERRQSTVLRYSYLFFTKAGIVFNHRGSGRIKPTRCSGSGLNPRVEGNWIHALSVKCSLWMAPSCPHLCRVHPFR